MGVGRPEIVLLLLSLEDHEVLYYWKIVKDAMGFVSFHDLGSLSQIDRKCISAYIRYIVKLCRLFLSCN